MEKVNLAEKFSRFSEHWSPKVVGELNGQQGKLAKLLGTFDWSGLRASGCPRATEAFGAYLNRTLSYES